MVRTYIAPSFVMQDATTYKTAIDSSVSVLSEVAQNLAPREAVPRGMKIIVDRGKLPDGREIPAQEITGIAIPTANPRIDRVVLDYNTGTLERLVGTEASSPTPPAILMGRVPICRLYLYPTKSEILNEDIVDERTFLLPPVAVFEDGYLNIYAPDSYVRLIAGQVGLDHRVIVRLHDDGGGARFVVQNSSGIDQASIDSAGRVTMNAFNIGGSQFSFERVDDTTMKIWMIGTDGVARYATLSLSP